MIQLIITFLILIPIYLILKPLIIMMMLKIQYGNAVYCKYVPIIGFMHLLRKSLKQQNDAYKWINDIVNNNPQVKIIVSNAFNKPVLILLDPEYYKPLYIEHEKLTKHDTSGIRDVFMKEGLLFTEGKKWRQQRKLLGEHFLFEKLQSRIPMMNQITKGFIGTQQIQKVYDFICSITGEIAIQSFFGEEAKDWQINGKAAQIELGDITSQFYKLRVNNLFVYMKQKLLGQKTWEYCFQSEKEVLQRVSNFKNDIKKIIFKRRDKILQNRFHQQDGDFLDAYMKIFLNQNPISSERIETNEIIDQFISLFMAGTDTTGALVTNSLLFLSENIQYIDELQQEINNFIGDGDVTAENLNKLVFIEAFLKEVLRLRPSVVYPIAREPNQEIKVKDLTLQKGWLILYGNSSANMNKNNYDNPQEFNPKRWLQQQPIKEDNGFINIPFSAGGRNCIGQHMAMIEAKIILAYIIRNYNVQRNQNVKQIVWPSRGVLTFSPSDAVHLIKK